MTGVTGLHPMPVPCRRCTGYGDGHYLTCPTLRLPRRLTLLEASDLVSRHLADAAAAGLSVREAVAAWARGEGDVL